MQQVCCWAPYWQDVPIDSGGRVAATAPPQYSTQQQMRAMSRLWPP